MNRRNFLGNLSILPTIPFIGSTEVLSKDKASTDKYSDPNYGNTFKTLDSIYTVREIEMMCREWGWIHVESFIRRYEDGNDQNWICQAGVGYFIGIDGNEYCTDNTYRTQWTRINLYNKKEKDEFKPILKRIAGDYYGKHREHYYFYDVLMPQQDYYTYDAYKNWDGSAIENPSKESLEWHGKLIHNIILYHMGVSHGKMWAVR